MPVQLRWAQGWFTHRGKLGRGLGRVPQGAPLTPPLLLGPSCGASFFLHRKQETMLAAGGLWEGRPSAANCHLHQPPGQSGRQWCGEWEARWAGDGRMAGNERGYLLQPAHWEGRGSTKPLNLLLVLNLLPFPKGKKSVARQRLHTASSGQEKAVHCF